MIIVMPLFLFFLYSSFLDAATPKRPQTAQVFQVTPVFRCTSQSVLRESFCEAGLLNKSFFLKRRLRSFLVKPEVKISPRLPRLSHRVMYGVDLDPDSIVVDTADGIHRRYPNKAYAHDARIAELYYAVAHKPLEQIKSLIEQGVDYTVRADFRTTLLMHASGNLRSEVVDYLLTLPNIDVNAQDVMGYTALYFLIDAATKDNSSEFEGIIKRVEKIIFLLKNAGLDFEYKPNRELGRTALELALARYHKNSRVAFVVKLLLQAGASRMVAPLYQRYLATLKIEV